MYLLYVLILSLICVYIYGLSPGVSIAVFVYIDSFYHLWHPYSPTVCFTHTNDIWR